MGARSRATAKSLAERAPAADELAAYCPDLEEWPRSWMYEERDLSPGQQVVDYFKPFLRHLLRSELSRKTLRKHRNNLWLLGGELILDLHEGLGLESSRSTGWCAQPSMTKADRSSPAARPKISNAPST